MKKLRLLLADDHPLFLEGLSTVLSLKDPELEVVGTVSNGQEAVEMEKDLSPDVVLMDIKMPVMDGIEAARLIRSRRKDIKIVMLTTFDDGELVTGALRAGADGYILKDTPAQEVIDDIKSIYHGNVLMSQQAAKKVLQMELRETDEGSKSVEPGSVNGLTEREQQILGLLGKGKDNLEIAAELFISEKTVRNYISRIYDVLGVHNRTKAVLWAREHGFL